MADIARLPLPATDGFVPCKLTEANRLLVEWGHNLGPVHRRFRSEPWLFLVDGVPTACAVSASTVSTTVTGYRRGQVVELARLCSSTHWANRLMLRWWREVGARRWECWPVEAVIAYSQNDRHEGRLYRFDGWTRFTTTAGTSGGGGTWTRRRHSTDVAAGPKSGWVYKYPVPVCGNDA